ncbi:ribosome biogenesis GTPase Der [candidate division KSB1 bacterium]
MATPIAAIVGRPNVGKSTLFNRIIQRRDAIVDEVAGVTRDRHYSRAEWTGHEFLIVDTGGYLIDFKDDIDRGIRFQVEEAVDEADLILFLTDIHTGITKNEQVIADMLRKSGKPTLTIANKVDSETLAPEAGKMMKLGFGEPVCISALHGLGIGDLLDTLVENLPDKEPSSVEKESIAIAIIGRPNVGKSSIVNAIVGSEKMLVTNVPGTTRDSIDSYVKRDGHYFRLIDTAGLRKKRRKGLENIEYYSTLRSLRSLDTCHIALVITDAQEGLQKQDLQIIDMAAEAQRGIILVLNKWDLIEKDETTYIRFLNEVKRRLKSNDYVEIISTSALMKQRVFKLLDLSKKVYQEWSRSLETRELNKWLEKAITKNYPPTARGKQVTIKYVTQTRTAPPVFTFFTNRPADVTEAYRRYLMNQIRDTFGFSGVPLKAVFRKK